MSSGETEQAEGLLYKDGEEHDMDEETDGEEHGMDEEADGEEHGMDEETDGDGRGMDKEARLSPHVLALVNNVRQ